MRIEYTCEVCGKRFATQEEAKKCEETHNSEKKREELKEKSAVAIAELIDKHIETFGEFPELKISNKSVEVLAKVAHDSIDELLNECINEIFRF